MLERMLCLWSNCFFSQAVGCFVSRVATVTWDPLEAFKSCLRILSLGLVAYQLSRFVRLDIMQLLHQIRTNYSDIKKTYLVLIIACATWRHINHRRHISSHFDLGLGKPQPAGYDDTR
ncbi:hypothetical protein BDW74DRAFT_116021 [Aspergillus multicolor]|uniref:uncharacterized protein n=1 Tax=Aspergillus multicolor TaxID=41759 RepID=UPI003CCCDCE7